MSSIDVPGAGFDLSQYPTEFLMCCEQMRHTLPGLVDWHWGVVRNTSGRPIEYRRTTQCLSCKAIVQDVIDGVNGTKKRNIRRPDLPQPYRIPKTAGVNVYAIRLELMSRFESQAETITEGVN